MAKPRTTKGRKQTRKVRDLAVKSEAITRVKGGTTLMQACATGEHIKKAVIEM